MTKFTIHTIESAPEEAKPFLENYKTEMGMVPNIFGIMAEAPTLLEAYGLMNSLFQKTSFTQEELTVVWQTINMEHKCHYCTPAHNLIAESMNIEPTVVKSLAHKEILANAKLEALRLTTLSMVRNRGVLSEQEVAAFFAVGYGQQQLLELVLGIAQKVISNYTNHLAETPLDEPFKKYVKI